MNKYKAGAIVVTSGCVVLGTVLGLSSILHKDNLQSTERLQNVTISEEPTAAPDESVPPTDRSISPDDYVNVQVIYNVDLGSWGGTQVPYAVSQYRIQYPVKSGSIEVVAFRREENTLYITMQVNGQTIDYTYIIDEDY